MPIKGLAERPELGTIPQGKFTRLGRLNKGERDGFGRNVTLTDLDYFRFTPYTDNETMAQRMSDIFTEVYGYKPESIDPVFIPVNLSGNFDIYNCAWLLCHVHSENRPSVFLGRSDGEWIYQLRTTSRTVENYEAGELSFADSSEEDRYGNQCLKLGDHLFPWQRRLQLELILPDLNAAFYDENISGFGVVEFNTSSIWDVSRMIDEYNGILQSVADVFHNPFQDGDRERWITHLPLREIPLRLFRQIADITRPDPKRDDPLARYKKPTSLCHLQLSPIYAKAMAAASAYRSKLWLKMTAVTPLLDAQVDAQTAIMNVNHQLFGDEPQPVALPTNTPENAWRDEFTHVDEVIEGIFDDDSTAVKDVPAKQPRDDQPATEQKTTTTTEEKEDHGDAPDDPDDLTEIVDEQENGVKKIVTDLILNAAQIFDGREVAFTEWAAISFSTIAFQYPKTFTSTKGLRAWYARVVGADYEPSHTIPAYCAAAFYAKCKTTMNQKAAIDQAADLFFYTYDLLNPEDEEE